MAIITKRAVFSLSIPHISLNQPGLMHGISQTDSDIYIQVQPYDSRNDFKMQEGTLKETSIQKETALPLYIFNSQFSTENE